jgi:hypothetical protein
MFPRRGSQLYSRSRKALVTTNHTNFDRGPNGADCPERGIYLVVTAHHTQRTHVRVVTLPLHGPIDSVTHVLCSTHGLIGHKNRSVSQVHCNDPRSQLLPYSTQVTRKFAQVFTVPWT